MADHSPVVFCRKVDPYWSALDGSRALRNAVLAPKKSLPFYREAFLFKFN